MKNMTLPFLSKKLNTIKASYLATLAQSRLRCTRNTELHSEAFITASACKEHTHPGSNDLTTQK